MGNLKEILLLDEIPFLPDRDNLLDSVRLAPESPDAAEFLNLVDHALQVASPKAIYRECYIDSRTKDTVSIAGTTFRSRTLLINLEEADRVFVYVATCGIELDRLELPEGDFLARFWLDAIKSASLNASIHHLHTTLEKRFALGKTGSMSPGSGDRSIWAIEQQKPLFTLLGHGPDQIGVTLTDSCLMLPNKTVSGFYFPSEKSIRTCQVCRRQNCPNRRAAFDPVLWEEIQVH